MPDVTKRLHEELTRLREELSTTSYVSLNATEKAAYAQKLIQFRSLLSEILHALEEKKRTAEEDNWFAVYLYLGIEQYVGNYHKKLLEAPVVEEDDSDSSDFEVLSLNSEEQWIHALQLIYGIGRPCMPQAGVKLLRIMAEHQDQSMYPMVCNFLGWIYNEGQGVAQSDEEAVHWWRLSAEQGHPIAQYNLADMYQKGLGVAQSDEEAVRLHRLSAEQGYAPAHNDLGWMYQEGLGVAQNYEEAARLYRLSAEQGNPIAQYNIADMYRKGLGVAQNYEEAVHWLRLAVEQDDVDAQYILAQMYHQGLGVTQNYKEAVRLYRLSAEQDDAAAQKDLGWMYQEGLGVAQSNKEAARLYRLSAEQGNLAARELFVSLKGYEQVDYHLAIIDQDVEILSDKLLNDEHWWRAFLKYDASEGHCRPKTQAVLFKVVQLLTSHETERAEVVQKRLNFLCFILENDVDTLPLDSRWYLQLPVDALNEGWLENYVEFLYIRWTSFRAISVGNATEIEAIQQIMVTLASPQFLDKLSHQSHVLLANVLMVVLFTDAFEMTANTSSISARDIALLYTACYSPQSPPGLFPDQILTDFMKSHLLQTSFLRPKRHDERPALEDEPSVKRARLG